jgi:hypothetical protein
MSKQILGLAVVSLLATVVGITDAAEAPDAASGLKDAAQLDQMAGQPVDISPWTYSWRSDRPVQEKPEAYFIPHRLERLDKVYRTAYHRMSRRELLGDYSGMVPGLGYPLPPQPKGELQAGLLWVGKLADYWVGLEWPGPVPPRDDFEVRVYPTNFGWFGWTVDEPLDWGLIGGNCSGHQGRSPTEMVAVFYDKNKVKSAPPIIRVIGFGMGVWKRQDVEIEWGFQPGTEKSDFDGTIETYIAWHGPAKPLTEDKGTQVTGGNRWHSKAADSPRRGIILPLLYTPDGQPALDSRVTVRTKTSGFTFRVNDLEKGPILIPEYGVFITKAGSGQTARQFAKELAAKNLKSLAQMVRERPEAASWEEVMKNVRLPGCPPGTALPPFPQAPAPDAAMQVQLSDVRWTGAWRAAMNQLQGPHLWGGLAYEVARVAHDMDMVGLHEDADKVYQYFLKSPGVKADGDYADGKGSLEWARSMRNDMGYEWDGTHSSTGRLLHAMADRYFLTGDKEWFQRNRARLQEAADWIVRQRTLYMKDVPNRQELLSAGLMPPVALGDVGLPNSQRRWYRVDNALSLQGLQRFADALAEVDPAAGKKYLDEADAFRKDIRRSIDRESVLAPVRRGHDGLYHTCLLSSSTYERGECLGMELQSHQRPQGDTLVASLPLAEPFAALDPIDIRIVNAVNLMEELAAMPKVATYLLKGAVNNQWWGVGRSLQQIEGMQTFDGGARELNPNWFWSCHGGAIPKGSFNADIFLLQDDVPNFLRFWMNSYALVIGADGKMFEGAQLSQYVSCTYIDNGTAGWFLEQFRNLLIMEEGPSLWIARATPRAWLEQGKKIAVKNAPSHFGMTAYEIVSDVDHGKISATVEIPSRRPPKDVLVRFRHPKAMPIKSVTVDGKPWTDFDPAKEIIRLRDVRGSVNVQAIY